MHPFEKILSVSKEEIEFELRAITEVSWSDFWLNPRKLRGSDFLMRWSQGVWSEKRLTDAINATDEFFAIPYGPSGRCWLLYQAKKVWQWARASSIEPKRSGKSGRYLSVLNCASE